MSEIVVPSEIESSRLDAWLAQEFQDLSRVRWQQLIKEGQVLVDGKACKANLHLGGGETIVYEIPPAEPVEVKAEAIALDILFEDHDVIAINKPPGLVVHPAPGHASGTLVNALLYHCKDLRGIGGELRPGIVHRLDKDTSGVMIVAKNETAMNHLANQFKERTLHKEYLALVKGLPRRPSGTIETLIGRSMRNRKMMSTQTRSGKPAVTHYETVERFINAALLRARIETGRTHQIRVHCAHLGHPILGDATYGRPSKTDLPFPVPRQMLHAEKLSLEHPATNQPLELTAPMPDDFQEVLAQLRAISAG